MVLDIARRVLRTGSISTGIDAPVIPARLMGGTPAVPQANRKARVAILEAYAHGLVIQDLANLVFRAGRAFADGARILALIVDACQVRRAFTVSRALDSVRLAGELSGVVHDETLAHAHRSVIADLAPFAGLARDGERRARVRAPPRPVVAGLVARAIVVVVAFSGGPVRGSRFGGIAIRIGSALLVRFPDVTVRARTSRLVDDDAAERVLAAGAPQTARVYAPSIYTSLLVRAV